MEPTSDRTEEQAVMHTPGMLTATVTRLFTEHPHATGETYMEHFAFTVKLGARLFYSSIALWLHGLFPFLCTRTASKQIEYMYAVMKSRLPQSAPENTADNGWYWYI